MGISIGSHSKTHDFLVSLNNPNSLHTELAESKLYLENLLGINVDGFAAPSGFSNSNIIQHALDVGYQQFYTVQSKYNMHPTGNVINRILMQGDNYMSNLIRLHGLGV
jgi:peptidoglycan/xylan/chitin deacetylase (PgdA/CDA1 family)